MDDHPTPARADATVGSVHPCLCCIDGRPARPTAWWPVSPIQSRGWAEAVGRAFSVLLPSELSAPASNTKNRTKARGGREHLVQRPQGLMAGKLLKTGGCLSEHAEQREVFESLGKGFGKAMKQMVGHLPCCKHSIYFQYGVSLRKTPHNGGSTTSKKIQL